MKSADRRFAFPVSGIVAALLALGVIGLATRVAALPPPQIREPVRAFDYYDRLTDVESARAIQTAVEHHITDETFWEQYRRKAWFRARAELEFVLRIVPNHPLALYLLEMVARLEEDVSYPIAYYERALRIFPNRAITRARYGKYLSTIGQREAALEQLREAVAADSTLIQARAWLDEVEASRGAGPPAQTLIDHAP